MKKRNAMVENTQLCRKNKLWIWIPEFMYNTEKAVRGTKMTGKIHWMHLRARSLNIRLILGSSSSSRPMHVVATKQATVMQYYNICTIIPSYYYIFVDNKKMLRHLSVFFFSSVSVGTWQTHFNVSALHKIQKLSCPTFFALVNSHKNYYDLI